MTKHCIGVSSFFTWCRNFEFDFVHNAQTKLTTNGRKCHANLRQIFFQIATINFRYKINRKQNYIFPLDKGFFDSLKPLKNREKSKFFKICINCKF